MFLAVLRLHRSMHFQMLKGLLQKHFVLGYNLKSLWRVVEPYLTFYFVVFCSNTGEHMEQNNNMLAVFLIRVSNWSFGFQMKFFF